MHELETEDPAASLAAPVGRPRRTGLARGPAAVVGLLVGVHAVILHGRTYVQQDDMYQFGAAARFGLSWDLLSLNVFMHFAPANRFAHWAVLEVSPLNPDAAFGASLLAFAFALAGLNWLLGVLEASPGRRMAALLLFGCSLPVFMVTVWLDSAIHTFGVLAMISLSLGAGVRAVERRSWAWRITTIALLLAGFLVQVRMAFAAPLLVALLLLVVWREQPIVERLRRLQRNGVFLTVVLVVAIVCALVERHYYADTISSQIGRPGPSVAVALLAKGIAGYFLPGAFGRPIDYAGPRVVAVTAVLMAVGAAILVRRSRDNWGPLVFFVGASAAHLLLIWFGVTIAAGADANASRLDYMAYMLVPAAVAVATIRWSPGPPRPSIARAAAGPRHERRRRRGLDSRWAAAAVGVLALVLLFNARAYIVGPLSIFASVPAYYDAIRASEPEWSDPDVTVLPLEGPPGLSGAWAVSYFQHEALLPLISDAPLGIELRSRPVVVDASGNVRDTVLETLADVRFEGCQTGAESYVPLPSRVGAGEGGRPLFALLQYESATPIAEAWVVGVRDEQNTVNYWSVSLPAGAHEVAVPVDAIGGIDVFTLAHVPADAGFCLARLRIVTPWLPFGADCQPIDNFGIAGVPSSCPTGFDRTQP